MGLTLILIFITYGVNYTLAKFWGYNLMDSHVIDRFPSEDLAKQNISWQQWNGVARSVFEGTVKDCFDELEQNTPTS